MYTNSTQEKYWMFRDENELNSLRAKINADFIEKHGAHMSPEERKNHFLSMNEEFKLMKLYELHLKDFGKKFLPAMPWTTIATALHYFKRFYLRKSVMDYHPKEILVTCLYLACKVEEFNVSISQFVTNIKGDQEKASNIILNNEMLLMHQLDYHLTVYNPFRPVDGFLIDIKTRYKCIKDPDSLKPLIDEFLEQIFLTDCVLIYSPSQIALAAIFHATSQIKAHLDSYVTDVLFPPERLPLIIEAVKKIRSAYKSYETHSMEEYKRLNKKLEKCRNQENNPDSQIYKQKMQEMFEDDDY